MFCLPSYQHNVDFHTKIHAYMELLSKTNVSLKQKSHRQTEMSISRKAKNTRLKHTFTATPKLLSLVLCMSVLLLGACRKSPKAINQTATEGNLTIQLNCLGADLRAGENDPMSAVKSLDLYFFSSESEPAERTMVAHRTFGQAELATNAPLSMSLPVASYYLVAVLNSTPVIQSTFGQGLSWSKLFESTYKIDDLYTKSENKITSVVWSNDQGPIQIDESAFDKGASSVKVTLTRAVARVRLFGEPKVPQYMSIDLTNGGTFRFGCRAKQAFLMRELAPLIGSTESVMEKPGDGSSFATRYAYSPGYLEIAKSDQSNQKALFKAFRVANEKNSIFNLESLRLIPKSVDDCDLTQQVYYTSETTIDPDHHTYYFLPAVLIGYKLYPASLDAIGDFKSDEGWVSFNGRYYRGRDFVTYLKAIYERNKATGNPKPLVTIPEGYPKELQDVCEDYVATLDDKMLIRAYPGELYPIDYKGLRYYLRSYNYYYLPVQHAPSQERYGHYGIVRNNDYRIEITSISDFGTPLLMNPADHPDQYVPKQPITATLTLTPLEERDNIANL